MRGGDRPTAQVIKPTGITDVARPELRRRSRGASGTGPAPGAGRTARMGRRARIDRRDQPSQPRIHAGGGRGRGGPAPPAVAPGRLRRAVPARRRDHAAGAGGAQLRPEEHTSELQSLMRRSYAVFGLKKNKDTHIHLTLLMPRTN